MKIAVISNDALRTEWVSQGMAGEAIIEWFLDPKEIKSADCIIDLLFHPDAERTGILQRLQPALIMVNAVTVTLDKLPRNFIRINGWPSFIKRPVVEACSENEALKHQAEKVFSLFHKTTEWVADEPGFITARVICMIINEAYFALQENVSSKQEIDLAMKLGTNYPFGPFEWSEKIGLMNIYELLSTLAGLNSRYEPAALLKKEALHL